MNTPWQIYCDCHFIVFFRQSDILIPKKLYFFCWIYLFAMNCLICFDTWIYYIKYTIDQDKYYGLANVLGFAISLHFLLIEIVINSRIIYCLSGKVLNQTNLYYKVIVFKLISVLILCLMLDIILMTFDITNNQMYTCFFWGFDYSFKIQIETLCLGKIRDMIVTMERCENSDSRRGSRVFDELRPS